MEVKNIFKNIPEDLSEEIVEKILEVKNIRIERIISKGQSSPPNFWYDQNENEFVIVVKGRAKLHFMGEEKPILISKGEYTIIPPHVKHRVEWSDPGTETIWLAVFY